MIYIFRHATERLRRKTSSGFIQSLVEESCYRINDRRSIYNFPCEKAAGLDPTRLNCKESFTCRLGQFDKCHDKRQCHTQRIHRKRTKGKSVPHDMEHK